MNAPFKTDVIIVGAGPTGLSLAAQLLRYGIDFVIFDKKSGVTDLSKALVVHARSLEIYDQIGLAKSAVSQGEQVQGGNLMQDGEVKAQVDFSGFGGELSPFPFMLILEQSKNEQLLYEHLQSHSVSVHWQTETIELSHDARGVRAILKQVGEDSSSDRTEVTQVVEAKYLVGCDGASSPTRGFIGLPFEGSTYPRLFYVADVEMDFPADPGSFYASLEENSFVLSVPMQAENRWRLIGNLPEQEDNIEQEVTFDQIKTKVESLFHRSLDISTVHWFSSYRVHTRHTEPFSVGRCFLAGDAAHIHTPAGGQGMNTGIQDAYNLAWKMAFVLRGYAKPGLLETYSKERLANAKRLLSSTDRFFDVAAGDRWYLEAFRQTLLPIVAKFALRFQKIREFIFEMVSEIAIDYRDHTLSHHKGDRTFKVKAGDRMSYFLSENNSIYNRLREPRFHLVIFSSEKSDYQQLQSKVIDRYGDCIDCLAVELSDRVAEIFGSTKPFMLVLRPDNYIGQLTHDISITGLETYLRDRVGLMQPLRI